MKRLFLIALLLCPSVSNAFILLNKVSKAQATTFTTTAIDTTGANLLVAAVGSAQINQGTLTDSKGNIWVNLTVQSAAADYAETLYYSINPTVGTGHTFTLTGAGSIFGAIVVAAFAGATTNPFDQQNGNKGSISNTYATLTVTPTLPNELIVSAGSLNGTAGMVNAGTFTMVDKIAGGAGVNYGIALAYFPNYGSVAPIGHTWTSDGPAGIGSTLGSFKSNGQFLGGSGSGSSTGGSSMLGCGSPLIGGGLINNGMICSN